MSTTKVIALPLTTTRTIYYELLLITAAFFVPFAISGPQLLTGSVVNFLLIMYAQRAFSKRTLAIVVLPSIGALLNNVILGTATISLFYFLPFIWLANYFYIMGFRRLAATNRGAGLVGGVFAKCALLFGVAYLLVALHIVPSVFLTAMGVFQLITAVLGGGVALVVNPFIKTTTS